MKDRTGQRKNKKGTGQARLDMGSAPIPFIPPTLAAVAAAFELDGATTAMFARVNVDGARPQTREGWTLVLLAIRQACGQPRSRGEEGGAGR